MPEFIREPFDSPCLWCDEPTRQAVRIETRRATFSTNTPFAKRTVSAPRYVPCCMKCRHRIEWRRAPKPENRKISDDQMTVDEMIELVEKEGL